MRRHVIPTMLLAALALTACGGAPAREGAAQEKVAIAQAEAEKAKAEADKAKAEAEKAKSDAAAANAPAAEAPAAPAVKAPVAAAGGGGSLVTVPDVVGMDHQLAQDTMQASSLYNLTEEDATGAGRALVFDRNWVVVAQTPEAGKEVASDTAIVLRSKKKGE